MIYRQYCTCHCTALALSNLFSQKKQYFYITQRIQLVLGLLKKLKPPFFAQVRRTSISECTRFILDHLNELQAIIQKKRKNQAQIYECLLKTEWESIYKATNIITSFIINVEKDDMKIEFIYLEVCQTIMLLKNKNTDISKDLLNELLSIFGINIFDEYYDWRICDEQFVLKSDYDKLKQENDELKNRLSDYIQKLNWMKDLNTIELIHK